MGTDPGKKPQNPSFESSIILHFTRRLDRRVRKCVSQNPSTKSHPFYSSIRPLCPKLRVLLKSRDHKTSPPISSLDDPKPTVLTVVESLLFLLVFLELWEPVCAAVQSSRSQFSCGVMPGMSGASRFILSPLPVRKRRRRRGGEDGCRTSARRRRRRSTRHRHRIHPPRFHPSSTTRSPIGTAVRSRPRTTLRSCFGTPNQKRYRQSVNSQDRHRADRTDST